MLPSNRSRWTRVLSTTLGLLTATAACAREVEGSPEAADAAAILNSSAPACRAGWCGARHIGATLPPWAQRIRDRGAAPAGATDGVWDPTTERETIDLLFLYTPAALAAEGSVAGIQRRIDAMLASANRVFDNSLTGVRINLVHVAQANQPETGDMLAAYAAFRNLSEVQALRENYKADIVFLMVEQETLGFLGLADTTVPTGDARSAFAAVRRLDPSYREDMGVILAHEIGHLLGSAHDREHSYTADLIPIPGVHPYSYGHRFEANGITFRDIMSYDPGVLLPYFSNPRLTYAGQPIGSPAGQPDEADVTQTITRMAPFVSRYRTANSRIGFTQSTLTVSESDSKVTVGLMREGDLSTSARVNLTINNTSTAKANLDYQAPPSFTINFAIGQSNAVIELPLLQDELPEGDEVLLLGLASVQGQHGLTRQSSLAVTLVDDDPSYTVIPGPNILAESDGEVTWSIRFSGNLAPGETRTLDIVPGLDGDSATADVDYSVSPKTLTFTESQRTRSFRVRTLPDDLAEPDEAFRLTLGTLSAQFRIADDDRAGSRQPFAIAAIDGVLDRVTPLPDGRVALAGNFSKLDGTARSRIALVHPTNGVDATFQGPDIQAAPLRIEGMVPAWAEQFLPSRAGGWIVAGHLGVADDSIAGNIIRLRPDGSLDPNFGSRINGRVVSLTEQADGRLLVGGWFTATGDRSTRGFVRLNADGSIDDSFRLEPGADARLGSFVNAIRILPNGQILIGGYFETYNRTNVSHLVRLNPDGTLDDTFPLTRTGVNKPVNAIQVLPDGRAYVGGYFTTAGGRAYRGLCRLTQDGSVDPSFRSVRPNGEVWDILPLPNGQVLIAGAFTQAAGFPRRYLALLNEDGSMDTSFDPGIGASDHTFRLSALNDGTALVTGAFTSYAGQPAPGIARVRLPSIAASFTGIALRPDGTTEAGLWGLPGANVTLESSADLREWSPVSTTPIGSLDGRQTVPLPMAGDQRFYRAR